MAELVVLILALVVLIAVVWKPASRLITGALDARSMAIRRELDEAAGLREEAQALLARYQRQLHDGEAQARRIVLRAEEEAKRLEERRRAELDAALARRIEQAMERIAQEEQRALAEVRARAAALTMRTTTRLVTDHLDEARAGALVDGAIAELDRKLA